jgi:hypothetical protein
LTIHDADRGRSDDRVALTLCQVAAHLTVQWVQIAAITRSLAGLTVSHEHLPAVPSQGTSAASGAKARQAAKCCSETEVRTGLRGLIAASKVGVKPPPFACNFPNLLKMRRLQPGICGRNCRHVASWRIYGQASDRTVFLIFPMPYKYRDRNRGQGIFLDPRLKIARDRGKRRAAATRSRPAETWADMASTPSLTASFALPSAVCALPAALP